MKITYTGKPEALTSTQLKKVDDKFAKLAKMLDMRGGEREAHVILTSERHLHNAEITVRFHDHELVGVASAADLFPAISSAQEKLEKQILRIKERFRDGKRLPKEETISEEERLARGTEPAEELSSEAAPGRSIFRIDHHDRRKPMTLEEALLEMEMDRNYVVYRDAETDRVSVLVRRRDGNFDLIEA